MEVCSYDPYMSRVSQGLRTIVSILAEVQIYWTVGTGGLEGWKETHGTLTKRLL